MFGSSKLVGKFFTKVTKEERQLAEDKQAQEDQKKQTEIKSLKRLREESKPKKKVGRPRKHPKLGDISKAEQRNNQIESGSMLRVSPPAVTALSGSADAPNFVILS